MIIEASECPICGLPVIWDTTKEQNKGIIKIRTRRRSTVLVHEYCYKGSLTKKGATK